MSTRGRKPGRRIGRIDNWQKYQAGQPDLDVFNPCFEGYMPASCKGTDLDGMVVAYWAPHGLWERFGHVLIMEHKEAPGAWDRALGQRIALEHASVIAPMRLDPSCNRSLSVIATYGEDSDSPTAWSKFPDPEIRPCSLSSPETMPHGLWIRQVVKIKDMGG